MNIVFLVFPRGKGKEVLAKELVTLTLTMGQKGDTTMPRSSMVQHHNMEELELSESIMDLQVANDYHTRRAQYFKVGIP
jgi:hypothetical protein